MFYNYKKKKKNIARIYVVILKFVIKLNWVKYNTKTYHQNKNYNSIYQVIKLFVYR